MTGEWLPSFLGALLGSIASIAAAFVARGTSLDTDIRRMALELHDLVSRGAMTVDGASALLDVTRPTPWWKGGRIARGRRTVDVWLLRIEEAQLLLTNPDQADGQRYPDDGSAGGDR